MSSGVRIYTLQQRRPLTPARGPPEWLNSIDDPLAAAQNPFDAGGAPHLASAHPMDTALRRILDEHLALRVDLPA
jgi:hypothetical protein